VGATSLRALSPEVLAELTGQESSDPFLTLLTLTHTSFGSLYLVNNTADIISNGNTFLAYPMKVTLPNDDGDTLRQVSITLDNVGLELIDELRTVTDPIDVKIEMILSTLPDDIQIEVNDLKMRNISYDKSTIKATLIVDDFLNTEIAGEKYTPTTFPGLF